MLANFRNRGGIELVNVAFNENQTDTNWFAFCAFSAKLSL